MDEIKPSIFDGTRMFDEGMRKAEVSAWQSIESKFTNFRGNNRNAEGEKEIEELWKSFR